MLTREKLRQNLNSIMFAARKQSGLTQKDVADAIGASQSNYSKMERGQLVPSAAEWALFCEALQLPIDCISKGHVDRLQIASPELKRTFGKFKIPKKYSKLPTVNVRYLRPLIHMAQNQYGIQSIKDELKLCQVDSNYFYNYDNQINVLFLVELGRLLMKSNSAEDMCEFYEKDFASVDTHGDLHYKFLKSTSIQDAFRRYLQHSNKYEANFEKEIIDEGSNHITLSLTPQFLTPLSENPLLASTNEEFLIKYSICFIKNFARYGSELNPRTDIKVDINQTYQSGSTTVRAKFYW